MHKNLVLSIGKLFRETVKHYNLDMAPDAKLKVMCFYDAKGEITDITWAGCILTPGMPYFNNIAALARLPSRKSDVGMIGAAHANDYRSVQAMHDIADKYCSGKEGVQVTC